ncbi:MAG: pseudouridine synthase [Bacillota bacterium]|nr:pseudouridine synthase [Bacillota bacterium]
MPKQRIDKIFSNLGLLSRSECSRAAKYGHIAVNGEVCKASDAKADPNVDVITYKGQQIDTRSLVYYMFNKPAGCITANEDKYSATIFDYIKDTRTNLSAVGRLDKDTTGILLITNDGDMNHKLLAPRYHVPKTYEALINGRLLESDIKFFERGVDIGDEKPTLPAKCKVLKENEDGTSLAELVIYEGRFHQVKRMFEAIGKPVIKLHRRNFGPLELDESLEEGKYRELTKEELEKIKNCFA